MPCGHEPPGPWERVFERRWLHGSHLRSPVRECLSVNGGIQGARARYAEAAAEVHQLDFQAPRPARSTLSSSHKPGVFHDTHASLAHATFAVQRSLVASMVALKTLGAV